MVLATQNPIELEGTFPLPEAQLDRFLMRMAIGYPQSEAEKAVLQAPGPRQRPPVFDAALDLQVLQQAMEASQELPVGEPVLRYAMEIVQATREHKALLLGISPRGAIAWMRAARALAFLRADQYVAPDHLRDLAKVVLGHRLVVRPDYAMRGSTPASLLDEIMQRTPLPTRVNPGN